MICPFCRCDDSCGREQGLSLPRLNHAVEVYAAVMDPYGKDPSVLDTQALYVAQDLVLFGHFPKHDPPRLVDVGSALDLIREVGR